MNLLKSKEKKLSNLFYLNQLTHQHNINSSAITVDPKSPATLKLNNYYQTSLAPVLQWWA